MSPDPGSATLAEAERQELLAIAHAAIEVAVAGDAFELDLEALVAPLTRLRASFVTLEEAGMLRGCIGTLEAQRPLAEDVAFNARRAALDDLRFRPVGKDELDLLEVKISVLSAPEDLEVDSLEELLAALRPDRDGLVIADGMRRATFLPSVWESLEDPDAFVRQLQRKAGLVPGSWSSSTQAARYTTEEFSDSE